MKSTNFPVASILPQLANGLQSLSEKRLNDRHWEELTKTRGLDAAWVQANYESVSEAEATDKLGYTAKSAGYWMEGVGIQGQFKPDKPWKSKEDKKAPKYRSSSGDYDAMLPNDPNDPTLWTDIEKLKERSYKLYGYPCLGLSEGFHKAVSVSSVSLPTVSVPGVEMGLTPAKLDFQGKRYLVPALEKYAKHGFSFIGMFDSDSATNRNVLVAEIKLGEQIEKFGVPYYSCTGLWKPEEGKGVDDYIKTNGAEKFQREVLAEARSLEALKKQLQQLDSENKTDKVPPADVVAHELAEQYREQLAFNNETATWMRYGADLPGMWSPETDEYIESVISSILDGKGVKGYGAHGYITNIVKKLRCLLITRKWLDRSAKELQPYRNGCLEVATGKLLPHSPGNRLTWQLPRDHNATATDWSTIEAFLDHASGGNPAIKDILLCFSNAVLKGRSDLQRFLHLIGVGGSGKGTYTRLITDLIGQTNIHSSTLEDWCGNRFEPANAHKKRLVAFWDEDKKAGKLSKFKSLTGGDYLRAEEKGKKAFQFVFDGMVIVSSNYPIFAGDASSGLSRRGIIVPFNATVAPGKRRNLNAEFQPELDAYTNYVLSIPDEHVTKVLMGLEDTPECTLEFWEGRMRTDSIAAWLNDYVVLDAEARTPIGADKGEGEGGTAKTLYGSYCYHAQQSGASPKAIKNFSPDLLELCCSILGWQVERQVTKTCKFIKGLRLRTDQDGNIPTHDWQLLQRVSSGVESGVEWGVESGCLQGEDLSKGVESNLLLSKNEKSLLNTSEESQILEGNSDLLDTTLKPLPDKALDSTPPLDTALDTKKAKPPLDTALDTKKAKHKKPCLGMEPQPWTVKRGNRKVHLPAAYPGTNGHNQVKEPNAIATQLKAIQSKTEYREIEKLHGETRTLWVFSWLLTYAQQDSVRLIASGQQSQGNLFD